MPVEHGVPKPGYNHRVRGLTWPRNFGDFAQTRRVIPGGQIAIFYE